MKRIFAPRGSSRRELLAGFAGLAGASWIGGRAFATTSSDLTLTNVWSTNYKILEIFCVGGLSNFETHWIRGSSLSGFYGAPDYDALGIGVSASDLYAFATADSETVTLGPMCKPLWSYDEGTLGTNYFLDRLRMVTLGHDLDPHEAARPLTLTGLPLGRPKQAGTGAAIEAAFGAPEAPGSVILHDSSTSGVALEAAVTGILGRGTRPLILGVSSSASANTFVDDLAAFQRDQVAPDDLSAYFEAKYAAGRSFGSEVTRSLGHDNYQGSLYRLFHSEDIAHLLSGTSLYNTTASSDSYLAATPSYTRTQLDVAAHVLNQEGGCRHALVLDGGVESAYDVHDGQGYTLEEQATKQAGNLFVVLDHLVRLVEAGTLDLDDTLVVIHSEYGRSTQETETDPTLQTRTGTEHHPEGYAAMLLGGPVGGSVSSPGSSGVHGSFDADGASTSSLGPADLKAAMLYAAGINPFYSDLFSTDDTDRDDVAELANDVFGSAS